MLQRRKKQTSKWGKLAEDYACNLLIRNSYCLVERNFRSKFGEIDIVATKDNTLIFVEVKARWSTKFGAPEEAVTRQKLWKIKRTGEFYSLTHPILPKKLRIDVVSIVIEDGYIASEKIIPVVE